MSTVAEYDKDFLADLYRRLYAIRVFETRCIRLYRQGVIRGYLHPYLGEEAIAVGVCAALRPQDYISSTHRGHGHCIARGADLGRMMAEITGKASGYCKGRGGSMHIADMSMGNLGANAVVGANLPITVGAALGAKIRGEQRIAAAFTSDGAANIGTFGESLNLAGAWRLPLIMIIENNQYAVSTPVEQATREPLLYRRAIGYGVPASRVDGNDVLAVYEAAKAAVQTCIAGDGPVVIEALTYRHAGHHVNDPGQYMPKEKLEHFQSIDPCTRGRRFLIELGGADGSEADAIEADVERQIDEAVAFATSSPGPSVEEFLREVQVYS